MSAAMDSYECPKCHAVSHHPEDVANLYCGRCHTFAEDLRSEVVTDFKHIVGEMDLTRKDCFTLAILTLWDCQQPDARLVHGWVFNSWTGERIQHAWCEMSATATYEDGSEGRITVAIDHTQVNARARIVPAQLLYEKTGAHNLQRFTLAEAVTKALAAGHDGPWE